MNYVVKNNVIVMNSYVHNILTRLLGVVSIVMIIC